MNLSDKKCKPCEGGMDSMDEEEARQHLEKLPEGWNLNENKDLIAKRFTLKDFEKSIEFVNEVAEIAEEQNHHPDIHIFYDEVVIELTTHAISGLSKNDFIVAAKVEEVI